MFYTTEKLQHGYRFTNSVFQCLWLLHSIGIPFAGSHLAMNIKAFLMQSYHQGILESFHDVWGNCDWTDEDKIKKQIQEIAEEVKKDERYQNAMQFSDIQNARDESERATWEAILRNMSSGMELYTAYQGDTRSRRNQSFRDWLLDLIFNATYQKPTTPKPGTGKVYSFDYEPPVSMVAEDPAHTELKRRTDNR